MNIILIYFAIKYKGDWDQIYQALEDREKVTLEEVRELEKKIKEKDWNIITIMDLEYPNKLKEAYKPPFVIWYKGDISLLDNKFICATGQQVKDITKERIEKFIPEIEKNYHIINPSLKGADEIIMANTQKPRLVVLANGIDDPYINHNVREGDLIISEYPEDARIGSNRLKARNRLIAAFSETLILFSSNSDIDKFAKEFTNLGKEIHCFPSPVEDEHDGNNKLIKQGANLITSIRDITKNE